MIHEDVICERMNKHVKRLKTTVEPSPGSYGKKTHTLISTIPRAYLILILKQPQNKHTLIV